METRVARSLRESAIRYPLTAILGVDSNLRVLRVLSLHGGMLASSEIIRRSRLVQESVRKALLKLVSLGVVSSVGSERSKVYFLNADHPFSSVLTELFRVENQRFTAILESIRKSADGKPFFSLFYYGSAARGEDGPDSDLDIGIIARKDDLTSIVEHLREDLRGASARFAFLPNVTGLDFDDIKRLDDASDPWWQNVKSEAIVLSGKRPEDAIGLKGEVRG
jgi:predicted nucleotidyltransferase